MQKLWGKRGKFLTIVILYKFLTYIGYFLLPISPENNYLGFFNSETYKITLLLISGTILVGLWYMKKWALGVWIGYFLVNSIFVYSRLIPHLFEMNPEAGAGIMLFLWFILFIEVAIPAWAIKDKWKSFS